MRRSVLSMLSLLVLSVPFSLYIAVPRTFVTTSAYRLWFPSVFAALKHAYCYYLNGLNGILAEVACVHLSVGGTMCYFCV